MHEIAPRGKASQRLTTSEHVRNLEREVLAALQRLAQNPSPKPVLELDDTSIEFLSQITDSGLNDPASHVRLDHIWGHLFQAGQTAYVELPIIRKWVTTDESHLRTFIICFICHEESLDSKQTSPFLQLLPLETLRQYDSLIQRTILSYGSTKTRLNLHKQCWINAAKSHIHKKIGELNLGGK